MSLKKFFKDKVKVDKVLEPIVGGRDKRYNADYKARAWNDRVLNDLHYKQIKYPKDLHSLMLKRHEELKELYGKEKLKELGIDSVNSMIVYAMLEVWGESVSEDTE